jgi:hypothetical protein
MSGFSAAWLTLREPYDRRARNAAVQDAVAQAFASRDYVAVVDLGCGTGATLRAVSALLPQRQHWRLIDHDGDLLAGAMTASAAVSPAIAIATEMLDLAAGPEQALEREADLLTMSALLDLVSTDWLDRLVAAAARQRLPLYAALTYDGRVALIPPSRDDGTVIAAVNRHQLTDKGFGPALGPAAANLAVERLRRNGFAVITGASDWCFGASDRDIQTAMLEGWAQAAGEMGIAAPVLGAWLAERLEHVAAGRATMRVGHVDLFANPM